MISESIRVVLVDDHSVVRAGLKAVLGATPDITVVGEASNGREAVELVARVTPDVVVMDLSMPGLDGVAATKEIVASGVGARVIILSMHAEEDYLVPAMEAGASGYLVKTNADRELVNAIRGVAHGEVYVQSGAARVLAKKLAAKSPAASERERFEKLTGRERDVLRRIALGLFGTRNRGAASDQPEDGRHVQAANSREGGSRASVAVRAVRAEARIARRRIAGAVPRLHPG